MMSKDDYKSVVTFVVTVTRRYIPFMQCNFNTGVTEYKIARGKHFSGVPRDADSCHKYDEVHTVGNQKFH